MNFDNNRVFISEQPVLTYPNDIYKKQNEINFSSSSPTVSRPKSLGELPKAQQVRKDLLKYYKKNLNDLCHTEGIGY